MNPTGSKYFEAQTGQKSHYPPGNHHTSENAGAQLQVIIKLLDHQHWWLVGGYDLEIGHFERWLAWWLPGE